MHRRSRNKSAPLEAKENESGFTKKQDEASFHDLLKDQKVCKVTKSKVVKASKKENLNYIKGFEEESCHREVSSFYLPSVSNSGKSPTLLKFRRRSTIGLRGSPENNALIQYIAQQRSKTQEEAYSQVSPFKEKDVRSLKDKIDAFQMSFTSIEEAEGETGSSGLSQVQEASQEIGCSQNKVLIIKEQNLELWRNKFISDSGGADLKENSIQNSKKTGSCSSEKPKKRVTFGEVLSPEIFDPMLPASTPLCKGATPVRQPSLQSNSPSAGPGLVEELVSQLNFDCQKCDLFCLKECTEPLQEVVEDSLAVDDLLPVGKAEADTDKADTFLSVEEQGVICSIISEGTDCSISEATDTKDAEETKNPRKNKSRRQKTTTTSATKRTQKVKRATVGKRRKKTVKKSLYGEREMASKKPLLSPIPEIPEVLFSASSPCSPEANEFFSGNIKSGNAHKDVQQKSVVKRTRGKSIGAVPVHSGSKDLDALEANSSNDAAFQVSDDDLKSLCVIDRKLSDVVPDAMCVLDTSEYFQQGKETACVKDAEESGFLMENEKSQGQLLDKAEQLGTLEFLEQQDTSIPEGAQGTRCPQEDSVRGNLSRKRSSAIYFPPVEKLGIIGNDLSGSPFNIEKVLSVPHLQNDSLEPRRRRSYNSGDKRVRRSMRLCKDAEAEGLAWIQIPSEVQKDPPCPTSAGKKGRTISTSILRESENVHHLERNLVQFSASGKENNNSFDLADRPCKKWRRKPMCLSTPQEIRTWSQTRRKSMTSSVFKKDRNNKKHSEEVEVPIESNSNA
ncbi:cell division cycle-associated protein 2 [Phaenicophaeus curvirostris]|uniref:cell division cycle-associated protein 2 n=1 Tax=Phaenicophaeus curvirostris TaxID=33595 RepID=UPI0037F0A0D6